MKRFLLSIMIVSLCGLLFINGVARAGITGKIGGIVVDQASGEILPGANIVVVGTALGAAADQNGKYFILKLRPGPYALRVSMIGYKDMLIEDVRVMSDFTTTINIELQEEVIKGEEVVITAKRALIQKDLTSSTQFVDLRQLSQLPVTDAEDGLMLQSGVFFDQIPVGGGLGSAGRGEARYSIRGGSQDEVKWYMDGVRTSTMVAGRADWGGSFTKVNLNAIDEIQVMTGGFNAEYGEAQSGIINVVTKDGGDKIQGSLEYVYGLAGQRHFGNYLYDQKTQKEFLDHTLEDGSLDPDWWTPYRQSQKYDYTAIPDHTTYLSLGGPLFRLGREKIRFFLSSQIHEEAYNTPHPEDTKNNENVMLNLSYQLRPTMKLRLSSIYNHEARSTLKENLDFTSQAKYYRGWGSLIDINTYNFSANWTHSITPGLFYELKLSHFRIKFEESPPEHMDLGESENPNIWGFNRYDGYEDEPFDRYAAVIINDTETSDVSLVSNLSWQFNQANLLKAGLELRYHTLVENESGRYPSFSTDPDLWINRGLHETFHPIQFSSYLQDKMEFESMILNLGLRYDYFNPNYDWFTKNNLFNLSIDPEYDEEADPDADQIDDAGHVKYSYENVLAQPREPARDYHMVSPRFGVSFPVSEFTLLHFNYGHFYQLPPLDQMFEFTYFRPIYIVEGIQEEEALAEQEGREPNHIPSNDGDHERVVAYTVEPLRPQKTIMFEAGVKHNFNNSAVLNITAFYKDVFDQTEERVGLFDRYVYGYNPFIGQVTPNQFYTAYFPGDYGDSRGFEVSLRTLFSEIFTVNVNYSFSKAIQGRASPRTVTIDENGNITYEWDVTVEKRIPVEKSFSRPHILRTNLYLKYPDSSNNSIAAKLLKGTSVSILYRYISGQAFTYLQPDDPPDSYDNYRYPAIQTVDMKVEKSINISKLHIFSFYVRITNLFNQKNLRSFGDVVFDAEAAKNYVENGDISTIDGGGYDISWQTWHEPRRYYFGMKYGFN